ncbi:flagellar filament capping protein FliD [Gracilibacillus marinus]|uniref:Flagellar hook-associated protein 2 n=1 Tax=Gracilibacillus marinus TaxID=630535 RepID=A0ABV8VRF2_9BACI
MSTMRISGFASGMDIDTMVKDLMKAESIPLQSMQKEKQTLQWKRDDYRNINKLLLDFKDKLLEMRMTTSYRARQVSSTNEDRVSATASSAASQTSFSISKVDQLATSASWLNKGSLTSDKSFNASKSLSSNTFAGGLTWEKGYVNKQNINVDDVNAITLDTNVKAGTDISVVVNGKGFKVADSADNLEANEVYFDQATGKLTFAEGAIKKGDTVQAQYITDTGTVTKSLSEGSNTIALGAGGIATDGTFSMTIDGDTFSLGNQTEGTKYEVTDSSGAKVGVLDTKTGNIVMDEAFTEKTDVSVTFQQNYTSFSVGANTSNGDTHRQFFATENESLNQIVSNVNSANLGVSMLYDSFTERISLTRTETGEFSGDAGADIQLSGGFLTDTLQFDATQNYTDGQNAKFTINGLDTERNSNTFQLDGVTFELKQTFDTTLEGQPVSVNISNDSEAVFENIKEFVETYNTLIDAINSKATETYYRDYEPLTDDQREELTDKQQEDWEDKAKSGLLRNDPILRDILSSMRTDFYSPVNNDASTGVFNQLAAIGITTTKDYMSGGKLEINEAKLKEAIESDPDAVENLFRGDGTTHGEKGIAHRLTDTVNGAMDKIYERAGRASYSNHQFTLGRNLDDLDKQMTRFQDRLTQIEDRYWRQFTAMEKAIAQYNNQASYLMQQFGGTQ